MRGKVGVGTEVPTSQSHNHVFQRFDINGECETLYS